jgi:RNA polymerase sigma-70 factor (ECF subfamily)
MTKDNESEGIPQLLRHAAGDQCALGALLESYRAKLQTMLQLRIYGPLRGRIDASDVIQEAFLDATCRVNDFLQQPKVPFYVWLRGLAEQRMAAACRRHLGAQTRDARREISLYERESSAASSAMLAARLVDQLTSPSSAAIMAERKRQLESALSALSDTDREILLLRHFEELSTSEAAAVLGLSISATCNRYVRALTRLKKEWGAPDGSQA